MRKAIFLTSLAMGALLFSGCSYKEPKSFESAKQVTINNSLLESKYNFVPKDPYLRSLNFAYELYAKPSGAWVLPNHLVVKTFLLAHNSQKIVIVSGNEMLLERYKDYFFSHGVSAEISLQKVDNAPDKLNTGVQLLFFNTKQ